MEDIITVLEQFAPAFSARVWQRALILLIGAILCRKERTVATILRVMGLKDAPRFGNYHRVLSKARWSGLQVAKILLGLLVVLVPVDLPIIIGLLHPIKEANVNWFTFADCRLCLYCIALALRKCGGR